MEEPNYFLSLFLLIQSVLKSTVYPTVSQQKHYRRSFQCIHVHLCIKKVFHKDVIYKSSSSIFLFLFLLTKKSHYNKTSTFLHYSCRKSKGQKSDLFFKQNSQMRDGLQRRTTNVAIGEGEKERRDQTFYGNDFSTKVGQTAELKECRNFALKVNIILEYFDLPP